MSDDLPDNPGEDSVRRLASADFLPCRSDTVVR